MKIRNEKGSFAIVASIILTLLIVATSGWYVYFRYKDNNQSNINRNNTNKDSEDTQKQIDEEDYLIISEWGVRVKLPNNLKTQVTYSLGGIVSDPDGNNIQAAKILIKKDALPENDCVIVNSVQGALINSGAQFVRSENDKPFNATRYRHEFKENILQDTAYSYHLGYLTPDCVGGGSNATTVINLQQALKDLEKTN